MQRNPRRTAWRLVRRALLGLGAFALLALALALAAAFALSRGWQRERVRAAVEAALTDALGADVSLAALEGPLLPSLELRGVRVALAGEPIAELDALRVRLDVLRSLRGGLLRVERVEARAPRLFLRRRADGSFNAAALAARPAQGAKGAAPAGLPIALARISARDGRLDAAWSRGAAEQRFSASWELDLEALELPLSAQAFSRLRGELRLRPDAGGEALLALADGALELAESQIATPFGVITCRGRAVFAAGALRAEFAATGRVPLLGEVRDARLRLALRGDAWDLEEAHIDADRATLDARGRGEAARVDALEVAADVRDLEIGGVALGDARLRVENAGGSRLRLAELALAGAGGIELLAPAELELRGGIAHVAGLELSAFAGTARIDGGAGAAGLSELHVVLRDIDAKALADAVGGATPLRGLLDADLTLDGPVERPSIAGRARLRSPQLAGTRLDAIDLELATRGQALALTARAHRDGDALLVARASLPRSMLLAGRPLLARPETRIELDGDAIDLAMLAPWLPPALEDPAGTARIDVTIRGAQPAPRIAGSLEVDGGAIGLAGAAQRVSGVRARIAFEADGLDAGRAQLRELQGDALGGRFEVTGALRDTGFEGLRVVVRGVDPAALAALGGTPRELAGALGADLRLDGAFAAPALRGELTWSEPRIGALAYDAIDAEIETRDPTLQAVVRLRGGDRTLLVVEAALERGLLFTGPAALLASPDTVVTVQSAGVDLGLLAPFAPEALTELRGTARIDAEIRGGVPHPRASGVLEIEGGSITVAALEGRFEPLAGRLSLRGDTLRFESFRIGEPGAAAVLTGELRLVGLEPQRADLALALERFPVARPGLFAGELSGALALSGPVEAPALGGEVEVAGLLVTLPDPSDPILSEIRVRRSGTQPDAPREGAPAADPLAAASADLTLRVSPDSRVRGRGAELTIAGALDVSKRPGGRPRYAGAIDVVRGSYTVHARRFDVRRGSAAFDGGFELDPVLDVEAVHEVRDVKIVAHLTGRASAPEVRLTGEPPMPEDDVLAFLLFGRPASALSSGQGQDVQAAAVAAAAGLAVDELNRRLTAILPVDLVDLRIDENGAPGSVGIGKYLGSDVFVRYGRTLGAEPEDEIRIELRLNPSWSVESQITGGGSAGGDVIWSRDY